MDFYMDLYGQYEKKVVVGDYMPNSWVMWTTRAFTKPSFSG